MKTFILVLYCADIDAVRERMPLGFDREKHGDGPVHYARERGALVIELYPAEDVDGRRDGQWCLR